MKKAIYSIIIVFWLVMLGLLVRKTYFLPTSTIVLDIITDEGIKTGNEWFGIYQQGKKIGYAHTSITQEADAYHLTEESEMALLVLGSVQRVNTVINSYTTKNFILKYFDFTMTSGVTGIKIKGAIVGKKLLLDIVTGGQVRNEQIPLKENPYLSPNIKPALVLLGLEPGKKYKFPIFNPATMKTEEGEVLIEDRERIKVGDAEKTVYKLKETFQGMEAYTWMTEEGDTIKEESPLGYVLLRESMDQARKVDKTGPSVDILSQVMIPSRHIGNPSATKFIKARLTGVSLEGFDLDGDRQHLSGDIIEVQVPGDPSSLRLPVQGEYPPQALQPTVLVQSDDKKIREQSSKILAGEHVASTAAKKLNEWVYSSIKKEPVVSIPSAVEVLDQLIGDCNEHTTLYTALARAAGIPTRMAAGIVYMRDGFYYHAWPEVWLGRWIPVDPTFNQFPADATHIRFVAGNLDRQSEILKLIGKLKVEVLEYR